MPSYQDALAEFRDSCHKDSWPSTTSSVAAQSPCTFNLTPRPSPLLGAKERGDSGDVPWLSRSSTFPHLLPLSFADKQRRGGRGVRFPSHHHVHVIAAHTFRLSSS